MAFVSRIFASFRDLATKFRVARDRYGNYLATTTTSRQDQYQECKTHKT